MDLQSGRVEYPVTLIYDVQTRWNSTLNMLERAIRMKDFTKEWIRQYPVYMPLWSTPSEWKQVEYILQVLEPIRFCTLWMSKTRGPTIHSVFRVYDTIFNHLDDQISNLSNKRIRWKVDIREALEKAKQKATLYYSKTENPRGQMMALGACLNPYNKLELFNDWDEVEGTRFQDLGSYTQIYRQSFIQYYNEHYRPLLATGPHSDIPTGITEARSTGFNRRSKSSMMRHPRVIDRNECIEYIDSPPETDYDEQPDQILYEPDILKYWQSNEGRFPNLSRMARDILAVQGGSVGVERTFSMGRDVIPYRRNRLQTKSIRATMIVKSYLQEELGQRIDSSDLNREGIRIQNLRAELDYESLRVTNDHGGYISDDNEEDRRDIAWQFVDYDGTKAFRREPATQLPPREENCPKGKGRLGLTNMEDIDSVAESGRGDRVGSNQEFITEDENEYEYEDNDQGTTDEEDIEAFEKEGRIELGEEWGESLDDEGEETDFDENQWISSNIPPPVEEHQRLRKRAGSTLFKGEGRRRK